MSKGSSKNGAAQQQQSEATGIKISEMAIDDLGHLLITDVRMNHLADIFKAIDELCAGKALHLTGLSNLDANRVRRYVSRAEKSHGDPNAPVVCRKTREGLAVICKLLGQAEQPAE